MEGTPNRVRDAKGVALIMALLVLLNYFHTGGWPHLCDPDGRFGPAPITVP